MNTQNAVAIDFMKKGGMILDVILSDGSIIELCRDEVNVYVSNRCAYAGKIASMPEAMLQELILLGAVVGN